MISLERYAELRAAVERSGDRDAALRTAGVAPAEWIQVQRHWLDALAAEIDTGGSTLAAQYCRAFEAARDVAPAVEAPAAPIPEAPAPPADKPLATAFAAAPPPAPVEPPPQPQLPSFMLAAPVAAPVAINTPAAPVMRPATMFGAEPARAASMPFVEGPPLDLPANPAPAARAPDAPRSPLTGTALALDVPSRSATPFQPDPAAAAVGPVPAAGAGAPIAPPAPSPPAAHPGASTVMAPSTSPVTSSPVTPFQRLDPEAMGYNLIKYAELVAARGERGADLAEVLSRFGIDAAAHDKIEAYWRRKFSEDGMLALRFAPQLAIAQKALAERRGPRPAAVGSGTALAVDAPRAATPFISPPGQGSSPNVPPANAPSANAPPANASPAAASPLPDLNVDQYAWLAATLRKTPPAALDAVLARFRLTAETRKELEGRWSKRMAEDPALRQTFLAALARHLTGGGG